MNGRSLLGSTRPAVLNYFALWARGPSVALALEHGGIAWEGGADYGNEDHHLALYESGWRKRDKKSNTFGHLPTLDVPLPGNDDDFVTIGHEQAILTFIGRCADSAAGSDVVEEAVGYQLMNEAEDIYRKLKANTKTGKNDPGLNDEQVEEFWTGSQAGEHNSQFGMRDHFDHLEAFHARCRAVDGSRTAANGRFTRSGTTPGECKLFTNLHSCVMIRPSCLGEHPALAAFYERFLEQPATQTIMQTGGAMPRPFVQYFE